MDLNSPFRFLPRLWSNWITLLGAVLTTCAGLALLLLLVVELASSGANPYASSILLLALPVVFAAGLLLIPFGLLLARRRGSTSPALDAVRVSMKQPAIKRAMLFVAFATVANVILFGAGGQRAVHHMDSAQFCGQTCHVMQPEWTSYSGSKHSRVACVQCHIGPGASWAVKSKLNGVKQVWNVLLGRYDRPIPTPVEHLRPSRDTCEQCHWPEKFTGNKLVVLPHFQDDKANTPAYNVLLLRVGGRNERTHKYEGIHWHVSDTAEVRYEVLDPSRTKVGKITVLDHGKVVSEYLPPERDRSLPGLAVRTMDCVDCHNRPTHVFDESPRLAVDRAMASGELDGKVPWLVKAARAVLQSPPADGDFRAALVAAYQAYPDAQPAPQALDQAARTLADLYRRNVYPKMNVGWGIYRSRLGHKHEGDTGDEIGCFRCHDGEHEKVSASGTRETLGHGCEKCHETIVAGEDPATLEPELKQVVRR